MKKMISLFVISICFVLLIGFDRIKAQITDEKWIPEGYKAIYTVEDLYGINNNKDGSYILMADIDMSATAPGGNWDFGNGWKPIENFSGILDGNGHKISNMNIYGNFSNEKSVYLGLFGNIWGGQVKNLGMEDIQINISSEEITSNMYFSFYVGSIAGSLGDDDGRSIIENCYSTGFIRINGVCTVGGIYGDRPDEWSYGIICNCYSLVDIEVYSKTSYEKDNYVGGIVGYGSEVDGCYFAGSINSFGEANIGSITGNKYCSVRNVYSSKSESLAKGKEVELTNAQMKTKECYIGFDFDTVWFIDEYSPYPYPQLWYCPQVRIQSLQITTKPTKLVYDSDFNKENYAYFYGDKYAFEFSTIYIKELSIPLKKSELDLSGGQLLLTYDDGYSVSISMDDCYKGAFFAGTGRLKDSKLPIYILYNYPTSTENFWIQDEYVVDIIPKEEILTITSKIDEIVIGESFTFNAEYSSSGKIQYSSSNSKVLKINKNTGEATAVKAGKAIITIKAGSLSKDIEVTVVKEASKNTGEKDSSDKDSKSENNVITSDTVEPDFELEVGEAFKLAVKKISSKKLSSSDKSVVTISKKGTVKAIAPGTATITIKDKSTKKVVAKYIVTVISEEEPDFELEAGETMRVALKTGYSMKSSNENIVSIGNKGKITGVKVGTATVTVYDKTGKEIEKYLVQVVK